MAIRRVLDYINMDAFLSYVKMASARKSYQIMNSVLQFPIMVGVGLEASEGPKDPEELIAGGLINGELLN